MALLQVRDFPQETYQVLAQVAKEQNRTIPQQVIFFLSSVLKTENNSLTYRRRKVLAELDSLDLHLPADSPTPAFLVRRDRDGFDKGGRLR